MPYETGVWDRLVNSKWPKPCPTPSEQEAITGAKRLYRKAMGRPFRGRVKITTGNRHTWIRGGVMYVNPDYRWRRGWPGVVHSISHYAHQRLHPSDKPHSERQLYLERDLTDYVLESGWLDGRLKRTQKSKPKPDLVKERYQRILAREKNWEKKQQRANNALRKVRREKREYERRHGNRL